MGKDDFGKVSVIVPVYNVEMYIDRCILSIINQTYKNLEIILVDDGATDNSGKICDGYALKDERIKVIHSENRGVSTARNIGLDYATGEYLVFVDSDDYIEMTLVEDCVQESKDKDADIVLFDWFVERLGNKSIRKNDTNYVTDRKTMILGILWDKILNYVWNKFYRKELWEEIRFPEGITIEDMYVLPDIFVKAHEIVYLEKCLYNYNRSNTNSITFEISDSRNKFGFFLSFKKREEFAKKLNLQDLYEYSRKRALKSAVTAYGINTIDNRLRKEQLQLIRDYCVTLKNNGFLSVAGAKYYVLAYGVLGFKSISSFYGYCHIFRKYIKNILNTLSCIVKA